MDPLALLGHLPYVGVFALAALGLYVLCAARNLIKRIAGLAILQASLVLFYAGLGAHFDGRAPILQAGASGFSHVYANPLPQAQLIGALIIGAGTIMVALALVVRIREAYGAIEDDEIDAADDEQDRAQYKAEHGA